MSVKVKPHTVISSKNSNLIQRLNIILKRITKLSLSSTFLVATVGLTTSISVAESIQAETVANKTNPTSSLSSQKQIVSQSDEAAIAQKMGQDALLTPIASEYLETTAQNVTSVSQLSDVRTTEWTFTALQSLVERYGCIAGYPESTFRGKQATSRYEFAAGLNACLDKVNEIVSAGLADKVSRDDLATLQKLQEEFAVELATLRTRVDALDAKTTKLEAQQFSTTTKLFGQAIFGLQGRANNSLSVFGVKTPDTGTNLTFGGNVQLGLITELSPVAYCLQELLLATYPKPQLESLASTILSPV